MSFALVIPAAGSGVRLGSPLPKALVEIAGVPLFVHAARFLMAHKECEETVIAAPPGETEPFRKAAQKHFGDRNFSVVSGGRTRQDSVYLAIRSLLSDAEYVLIHDAARPFLSEKLCERVLNTLSGNCAAALPGLKITDTVKRVHDFPGMVRSTLDREQLVTVQTPQGIRREIAIEAFRRAAEVGFFGTDDVSLIEHFSLGIVQVVEGDPRNIKITTQEDLALARRMIEPHAN